MQSHERAYWVEVLLSNTYLLRAGGDFFLWKNPGAAERASAWRLYQETLDRADEDGLMTEEELRVFLLDREEITLEEEKQVVGIASDIDDLKVKLFQSSFKSKEQKEVRRLLGLAKAKHAELHAKAHAYDHQTGRGAATAARLRYLVGAGVHKGGERLWPGESFLDEESNLLEECVDAYLKARPTSEQLRELARTEPWQGVWASRTSCTSLFGLSASELHEEQREITGYSRFYDSIREHPEAPSEEVIADDDMLDGWVILQKRKQGGDDNRKRVESLIGDERIRNAGEVFLVCDTPEDAARIDDLNDDAAKATKAHRWAYLQKHGSVRVEELPDVQLELQMQANARGTW